MTEAWALEDAYQRVLDHYGLPPIEVSWMVELIGQNIGPVDFENSLRLWLVRKATTVEEVVAVMVKPPLLSDPVLPGGSEQNGRSTDAGN